eukprot:TCONS_00019133-protein
MMSPMSPTAMMKPTFQRSRSKVARPGFLYRRRTLLTLGFFSITALLSLFLVIRSKHFLYRHQIQIEKLYYSNKDFAQDRNAYMETIEGKGDQNLIANNEFLKQIRGKGEELSNTLYRLNNQQRALPYPIAEESVKKMEENIPIRYHPESKETKKTESKATSSELINATDILKKLEELTSKVGEISKKIDHEDKENTFSMKKNNKASVINPSSVKKCVNSTILFLVTSHSSNRKRRAAIRNNWGFTEIFRLFKRKFNLDYQVYFSVGLADNYEESVQIKAESEKYKDILIIDRNEDFYDLTRRVMAGFEWAVQQCEFTYLFKIDDDIFINIPNVMQFISNTTITKHKDSLYAGDMNIQAPVIRDSKSKYMVTYKEWPTEIYPPYCSGGGFIISRDIIKQIIPFFDWEDPFKIDDAYIGILIQRARIENIHYFVPEDDDMFWFYSNTSHCQYRPTSLVYHKVGDEKCMQRLTSAAYLNTHKIVYKIEQKLNEPKTENEVLFSVKIPFGFARNMAIKKPVRKRTPFKPWKGKFPSLSDLPKADSPIEMKKKQRNEYLKMMKSRLSKK